MTTRSESRSVHRAGNGGPADLLNGPMALLAAPANVIMQLSQPPIGYGVIESRVESGQVTRHPIKRLRTTLTYLAVALTGSEADRATFREAVDRVHARVRSGPDSPVAYNAFDPALQLWVAACLYRGTADIHERVHGPADPAVADSIYRRSAGLATGLQVPAEMWPADRSAFETYWSGMMESVSIGPAVRAYLDDLARLRHLPRPVQLMFGSTSRLVSAGFLPPQFRAAMGYGWSHREDRRFRRLIGAVAGVTRRLPAPVRGFPFTVLVGDMRRRVRAGRPLV